MFVGPRKIFHVPQVPSQFLPILLYRPPSETHDPIEYIGKSIRSYYIFFRSAHDPIITLPPHLPLPHPLSPRFSSFPAGQGAASTAGDHHRILLSISLDGLRRH